MLEIRELDTDAAIGDSHGLMSQLRPHVQREKFVGQIQRQRSNGYRLYGGFDESRLTVLAGVRDAETLSCGAHLFVDDLVTDKSARGRGHGATMLRWLAEHAVQRGFDRVNLVSRDTAKGFYQRMGFTLATSTPCTITVGELRRRTTAL